MSMAASMNQLRLISNKIGVVNYSLQQHLGTDITNPGSDRVCAEQAAGQNA